MTDRPRPHVPISVRLIVIDRLMKQLGVDIIDCDWPNRAMELGDKLKATFGVETVHLDHDPPLILREYDPETKLYTPDANDPDHLFYMTKRDHHLKTNVRGDGARRSDTSERMHQRRMDENRGLRKRRPKAKIAQRKKPWPKGRKLRSRKGWR